MDQISTEKKLALVRSIREENQVNLSKMRNREQILFGHSVKPNPSNPRISMGAWEAGVTGENSLSFSAGATMRPMDSDVESVENPVISGLKVRMFLAVLLFVGFLLIDGGVVGGKQINSLLVQNKINETFTINHLTDLLTFKQVANMIGE